MLELKIYLMHIIFLASSGLTAENLYGQYDKIKNSNSIELGIYGPRISPFQSPCTESYLKITTSLCVTAALSIFRYQSWNRIKESCT